MKKQTEVFNRRQFLRTGAAASGALLLTGRNAQGIEPSQTRFDLEEATIADLQARMQRGELSSERITEKYLERIEEVDKRGARLNSVIEINPDAVRIAEELDRERKNGRVRSQLHGIPILIKDNIDSADKMLTTAGSLALMDNRARADAFLVQKLRQAGAVILGKTNLSEWANFRSTKSTSGWSGRGGQTKNPYILDRNACGSSTGSGVAPSANLCVAAVGTETDGSVVCPASNTGIVGIKPTLGLVSRSGIIPISHSQDTAGPMARTVADAVILLGLMAGSDPRDSATRQQPKADGVPYDKFIVQWLETGGIRGKRIGVMRQYWGKNDKVDRVMNSALDVLKTEGATLVDVKFPNLEKFGDAEFEVLLYEFKDDLNKYLATATTKYKTLAQLIEFNEQNKDREMPYFGQELFIQANKKGGLNERAYRLALQKSKLLTQAQGIDLVMNQNKLDALVAPTNGPAWMTDLINGDCGYLGTSSLAAVAGYPNITVPAGFVDGTPIGISFMGRAWSETMLIKIAYSFEQATKARRVPQFQPSLAF